jgi:hypothetical protein
MKSKWWKECHRVTAEAVSEEVFRGMDLPERPKDGLCYTPLWTDKVKGNIRQIAMRWRKSPLWDQPQSTDRSKGVDFTNNNEATVKKFLADHNLTSRYLEGRG